jgi:Tol biopolymer transport system component
MTLAAGSKLGPYEILAPLGAGGMGEVYRAKDPRLSREVAVKVLPDSLGSDPDRVRRFEQEARAAGQLNHPNVTAVYDVGTDEATGSLYIVSELLEGETLRSRLAGGPLPLRKALDYARQICAGLAAAHEKNILHRDLKPENIFATREGRVKILDLGLAKLTQKETAGDATSLPTATAGTEPGVVLGTLAYMSPEQVRGKTTDARSDIFSFGAVLYEMLSGRRAFHRDSAADTISAILKEEPPDLSATNQSISPGLDRIVRHCLEKNPEERFHSAHDLAFDLESLSGTSGTSAAAASDTAAAGRRRAVSPSALAWGIALLAAGLAAGALLRGRAAPSEPGSPPRLRYLTHSGDDWHPSVSPDGKLMAFVSSRGDKPRIWIKELSSGSEVALTQGDDVDPSFTSDGSAILFRRFESNSWTLYRVAVVGGEARRIMGNIADSALSPDGRRLAFTRFGSHGEGQNPRWGLWLSAADGGGAKETAEFQEEGISDLCWSPDGTRLAAVRQDTRSLRAPPRLVLIENDGTAVRELSPVREPGMIKSLQWDPAGEALLYAQVEVISSAMAITGVGHLRRREIASERVQTLLSFPGPIGANSFGILGDGRIALDVDLSQQNIQEVEMAASASPPRRFVTHGLVTDRQPIYSPDGGSIVVSSNREGQYDLWRVSRTDGALRRLTEDPGEDWDPAFTPDGKKLLWSSNRTGHFEIWMSEPDGSGARQVTRDGVDAQNPTANPDGSWIVYHSGNIAHPGVWRIRPDGTDAVRLVSGEVNHPEVSPDGRHVLYFWGVAGGRSLRIATFEDGKTVLEIPGVNDSRGRWMPDGMRFVYLDWAEQITKGPILFIQDFSPGTDTTASRRRLPTGSPETELETFGISPDGKRIALSKIAFRTAILLAEGVPGIKKGR